MNVETLIEILSQVKDKKLLVRLTTPQLNNENIPDDTHDYPNFWLHSIFVHNKGDSGYEENGEVVLSGQE